jgi:hypothetical protein
VRPRWRLRRRQRMAAGVGVRPNAPKPINKPFFERTTPLAHEDGQISSSADRFFYCRHEYDYDICTEFMLVKRGSESDFTGWTRPKRFHLEALRGMIVVKTQRSVEPSVIIIIINIAKK